LGGQLILPRTSGPLLDAMIVRMNVQQVRGHFS